MPLVLRFSIVMTVALTLVVLRSEDIFRAASFYSSFGLQFRMHRHGSGPEHFAAELSAGGVFEIYPAESNCGSTLGVRIGLRVPSVDEAVAALSDYPNAVLTIPSESEWGRRAIVADPDGHVVELFQF